jgi:hypothetical protein
MGNLMVNIMKNILVTGEKEKVVLKEELDKERESSRRGMSIMWKFG